MTDSYADLAAALHEFADRIASFDDRGLPMPHYPRLRLVYSYAPSDAAQTVPAVDAIAAALGVTATTQVSGRGANRYADHKADHQQGPLKVHVSTSVPPPPLKRRSAAEMQAELDRLNNELAEAKRGRA